ncbi:RasGEF domain-containing protein [Estrella lausannensis]|uniref:Ras-GEF domain-containing protein n=1 Tax=Estrella lausannensis TaxID=483423 RepID=A0A0H5DSH4_9BACT|nr:RasGEF domain-containing protein [Estrella lausannensis]CRX39248.1 Hypothetical protein ELAC_1923 [Estrella lausannensis]
MDPHLSPRDHGELPTDYQIPQGKTNIEESKRTYTVKSPQSSANAAIEKVATVEKGFFSRVGTTLEKAGGKLIKKGGQAAAHVKIYGTSLIKAVKNYFALHKSSDTGFKEYFKVALQAEKANRLSNSIQLISAEKEQFSTKMEFIKGKFQSHVTDMHLLKSGNIPLVGEAKIDGIREDLELGITYLTTLAKEAKSSGNPLEEALFKTMAETIEGDLKFINSLEKDNWGNYRVKKGVELLKARNNLDAANKELTSLQKLTSIPLENLSPAELGELRQRLSEGVHLASAHVMEISASYDTIRGGLEDAEIRSRLDGLKEALQELRGKVFTIETKMLGAEWKQSEHKKVLEKWVKGASGQKEQTDENRQKELMGQAMELKIFIDKAESLIEKGEQHFPGYSPAMQELQSMRKEAKDHLKSIQEEHYAIGAGELLESFEGSIKPFFEGLQEDIGHLYSLTPSHVDKLEASIQGFVKKMDAKLSALTLMNPKAVENDPVLGEIADMKDSMQSALKEIESYRLSDIAHEWIAELFQNEEPSKLDLDIALYSGKIHSGVLSEYSAIDMNLKGLDAEALGRLKTQLTDIKERLEKDLTALEGAIDAKESAHEPINADVNDDVASIREAFHAIVSDLQDVKNAIELDSMTKEMIQHQEAAAQVLKGKELSSRDIKQTFLAWRTFKEKAEGFNKTLQEGAMTSEFLTHLETTESKFISLAEVVVKSMNQAILREADSLLAASSIEEYTAGDVEKLEKCVEKLRGASLFFEEVNNTLEGIFDASHPLAKESALLTEKSDALQGKMDLIAGEVVHGQLKKGMFEILDSSVGFSKLKAASFDSAREKMIAFDVWIKKAEERSASYALLIKDLSAKREVIDDFTPALASLTFMIDEAKMLRAEAFRVESSALFHGAVRSIESDPLFQKGLKLVNDARSSLAKTADMPFSEQEKFSFLQKESVEELMHDLGVLIPQLEGGVAALKGLEEEMNKHGLSLSAEESQKKCSLEEELGNAKAALHRLNSLRPPQGDNECYTDAAKTMGKEGRRIADKKTTGGRNVIILERQIQRLIDDPKLVMTEKAGQLIVDKKEGLSGVYALKKHLKVFEEIAKKCATPKEFSDEGYSSDSPVGLSAFEEADLQRIQGLLPKIESLEWIGHVGAKHPEAVEELKQAFRELSTEVDRALGRLAERRVQESIDKIKECRAANFSSSDGELHVRGDVNALDLSAALLIIKRMTERDPLMKKAYSSLPAKDQEEITAIKALLEKGLNEAYMAGKPKAESFHHLMLSLSLNPKTAIGQGQEEFATFDSMHLGLMNYDGLKKKPHLLFEAIKDAAVLGTMTDEGRKDLFRFVLKFYDGGLYSKAIQDPQVTAAVLYMAEYAKANGDSELVHLGNRIENAALREATPTENKGAPEVKAESPGASEVLDKVRKKGLDSKRKEQAEHFAEALRARRQEMIHDMDFSDLWQIKVGENPFWVGSVGKMIAESTNLSHFATLEILKGNKAKERANTLEFFIEVAYQLVQKGDYDSAQAIMGGAIKSTAVLRQKKTFSLVSDSAMEKYRELDTLFSPEKNSKNYNDAIRQRINAGQPVIPYLGTSLTMITFLGSRPDMSKTAPGQINQSKAKKGGEILSVFEEAKKSKVPSSLNIGGLGAMLDGFPAERDAAVKASKKGGFDDYTYHLSLEKEPKGQEPAVSLTKKAKALLPGLKKGKTEGAVKPTKSKAAKPVKPKKVPPELSGVADLMKQINEQAGGKFASFVGPWNDSREMLAKLHALSGSTPDATVSLSIGGKEIPVPLKDFIAGQGADFVGQKIQSAVDQAKRVETDPMSVIEEYRTKYAKEGKTASDMDLTKAFGALFLSAQAFNQEACKLIDKMLTQAMNDKMVALALFDVEAGDELRPEQAAWNKKVQEKLTALGHETWVQERLHINQQITTILRKQGSNLDAPLLKGLLAEVGAFIKKWEGMSSAENQAALAKVREEMGPPLPRFFVNNHPDYPGLIFDQDAAQANLAGLKDEAAKEGIKSDDKEALKAFVESKGFKLDPSGSVAWKTPSEEAINKALSWKHLLQGQ